MPDQSLPTAIDPRAAALIQALQPGASPVTTATANLQTPPTTGGVNPMENIATQQMEWAAGQAPEQLARARAASTRLGEMANEEIPPLPRTSWADTRYGPSGVGGNILRALEAFGGATAPGRQMQAQMYGPALHQWEATYGPQGTRAQTIAALREQAQVEEQPLTALTTGPARMMTGMGGMLRGEAAIMSAETKRAYDAAMVPLRQQQQQIQAEFNAGRLTQEAARTKMEQLVGLGRNQAIQAIAGTYADQRDRDAQINAMENELKVESEHWFQNLLGVTQPPSQQPTAPPGPKARGSAVTPSKGATPARPKGVPNDAKWDAKTQTWYK